MITMDYRNIRAVQYLRLAAAAREPISEIWAKEIETLLLGEAQQPAEAQREIDPNQFVSGGDASRLDMPAQPAQAVDKPFIPPAGEGGPAPDEKPAAADLQFLRRKSE